MTALNYESSRLLNAEILEELAALSSPEPDQGDLLTLLVEIFGTSADETIGNIRASAAASELGSFGEAVHKLKGSSGSIGAAALYECCRAVDHLFKTKQLSATELGVYAQAIGHELDRAKVALGEYVRRQEHTRH